MSSRPRQVADIGWRHQRHAKRIVCPRIRKYDGDITEVSRPYQGLAEVLWSFSNQFLYNKGKVCATIRFRYQLAMKVFIPWRCRVLLCNLKILNFLRWKLQHFGSQFLSVWRTMLMWDRIWPGSMPTWILRYLIPYSVSACSFLDFFLQFRRFITDSRTQWMWLTKFDLIGI